MFLGIVRQVARPILVVGFFCYNKLFPDVARARVMLIDDFGYIFLVRHWSGRRAKWSLPGGGVKKGEAPVIAAQRELSEELGVLLEVERFDFLVTLQVSYTAPIFVVRAQQSELPPQPFNRREIVAAGWFALEDLPEWLSTVARLAIDELSKK